MNIGDKIKDIEDEDCYFIGVVTQLDPLRYLVQQVVWNGEDLKEDLLIGTEIESKWWKQEIIK